MTSQTLAESKVLRFGFTYSEYLDDYGCLQCALNVQIPGYNTVQGVPVGWTLQNIDASESYAKQIKTLEERINENYRLIPRVFKPDSQSEEETSDEESSVDFRDDETARSVCK